MENFGLVDTIFLFSAILISLSYFFKDILALRLLSAFGCIGYLAGGLIAGFSVVGMTTTIIFSSINFIVNLVQSIRIILDRKPILLPQELKEIYISSFYKMTPNEFMKVFKLAKVQTAAKEEKVTIQQEPVEHLILIKKGIVKVLKNGKEVNLLSSGFFIGEMSFLTGSPATATVEVISNDLQYISWDRNTLAKLYVHNPLLHEKLKEVVALNLVLKIDGQKPE